MKSEAEAEQAAEGTSNREAFEVELAALQASLQTSLERVGELEAVKGKLQEMLKKVN